ncbi:MAG TPA: DUF1016 N-terminal domain-containing protein [Candidatus Absconditabacterales bacterium]|nr:DUF1016 N-terminal domain-containing protein [Candidatus Absconditabacterales bacterium]HNG96828.1 DUF1016 N-terminal domain-containing protein [Candidatus Absconditabacterales bacterium]
MTTIKPYTSLIDQIGGLLSQARTQVVSQVNQTMVMTYRTIGQYIVEYEQGGADRAEYGSGLLQKLADDLSSKFGKGFLYRNIRSMKQFYLECNNWQTLSAKFKNLSRSHLVRLMYLKDQDERQFFMIECSKQSRTSRELDRQINSALYHRLALSRDKKGVMMLAQKGQIIEQTVDLVKDPYILDYGCYFLTILCHNTGWIKQSMSE